MHCIKIIIFFLNNILCILIFSLIFHCHFKAHCHLNFFHFIKCLLPHFINLLYDFLPFCLFILFFFFVLYMLIIVIKCEKCCQCLECYNKFIFNKKPNASKEKNTTFFVRHNSLKRTLCWMPHLSPDRPKLDQMRQQCPSLTHTHTQRTILRASLYVCTLAGCQNGLGARVNDIDWNLLFPLLTLFYFTWLSFFSHCYYYCYFAAICWLLLFYFCCCVSLLLKYVVKSFSRLLQVANCSRLFLCRPGKCKSDKACKARSAHLIQIYKVLLK